VQHIVGRMEKTDFKEGGGIAKLIRKLFKGDEAGLP
jgi:hypothetical protein